MVYVTGDLHGDITRFKDKRFNKLKRRDYLIVCGDFGFIWDNSKKEQQILKKLGKMKYYILFVDGCHENFNLLEKYPVEEFCGGEVHKISGRLMHLMRGNVYDLDGVKVFAFGGGHSEDIDMRSTQQTWWQRETPSIDEIENGVQNLKKVSNSVDVIVSHEPPAAISEFLHGKEEEKIEMNAFFDDLRTMAKFKFWYFGKFHINKIIPPLYHALFDDVVPAVDWDTKKKLKKPDKNDKKKGESDDTGA